MVDFFLLKSSGGMDLNAVKKVDAVETITGHRTRIRLYRIACAIGSLV
jgi:hypothetical protein